MSTTRTRPSQSLPPPISCERPLNVNEISKHLSMLENRWNGVVDDDNDDDAQSEATVTTGTTTTGDGMDTPRASDSQDGEEEEPQDEMVSKVIANLQAKIDAVKRHRRVAAEVAALRKLLAEKERDLMECERVMALEMGQVEG